ncbi:sterile alpha motif domain-containing protein 1-like isoform X2 [Bos indicus]|uniref:Sterile alpha motif domain-containing protein 1-like isoform X2 n=1 Tax=Bos indicus TaxID=9915 RepID=A0ABM4SAH3_BOSIN
MPLPARVPPPPLPPPPQLGLGARRHRAPPPARVLSPAPGRRQREPRPRPAAPARHHAASWEGDSAARGPRAPCKRPVGRGLAGAGVHAHTLPARGARRLSPPACRRRRRGADSGQTTTASADRGRGAGAQVSEGSWSLTAGGGAVSCCAVLYQIHLSPAFYFPHDGKQAHRRDLPNPGIKARSPALQADSLPTEL